MSTFKAKMPALFASLHTTCVVLEGHMSRYLELLESEREAVLSFDTEKLELLTSAKIELLEAIHGSSQASRDAVEALIEAGAWTLEATALPEALRQLCVHAQDPMVQVLDVVSRRLHSIDAHVRTQHTQNQDLTRRSLGWIHTCLGAIDGDAVGYNKYGARRGSVLSTMQLKV